MNNFNDYGFEADFEGEILRKTKHDIYIGYVVDGVNAEYAIEWNSKGDNLLSSRFDRNFNLTPIKKEWYENPNNFPCLIVRDCNYLDIARSVLEDGRINLGCISTYSENCRPATKEEILTLLVKE